MNADTMKAVKAALEGAHALAFEQRATAVQVLTLNALRLLNTEASQQEALVKTTTTQLCAECFKPMESGNGENTCPKCQQDREAKREREWALREAEAAGVQVDEAEVQRRTEQYETEYDRLKAMKERIVEREKQKILAPLQEKLKAAEDREAKLVEALTELADAFDGTLAMNKAILGTAVFSSTAKQALAKARAALADGVEP